MSIEGEHPPGGPLKAGESRRCGSVTVAGQRTGEAIAGLVGRRPGERWSSRQVGRSANPGGTAELPRSRAATPAETAAPARGRGGRTKGVRIADILCGAGGLGCGRNRAHRQKPPRLAVSSARRWWPAQRTKRGAGVEGVSGKTPRSRSKPLRRKGAGVSGKDPRFKGAAPPCWWRGGGSGCSAGRPAG
jgi:hypothetical protein